MKRLLRPLFKNIFAGFLAVLPGLLLILIFDYLYDFADFLYTFVFERTGSVASTLVIFLSVLLLLFLIGYEIRKKRANFLIAFFEKVVDKIPVVEKIYKTIRYIINIFSGSNKEYLGVVKVQLGAYRAFGFVTSKERSKEGKTELAIFCPTTPNPTSGFVLFAYEEDVEYVDIEVTDAMQQIISLGANKVE